MRRASWFVGLGALGLVGPAVLQVACSNSDNGGGGTGGSAGATTAVTALRGTVKSTAGEPLSDVTVSAGGVTAISGADGRFELLAPAGSAVARFTKTGYVDGLRPVSIASGRSTQLDLSLLPVAPAIQLDATAGGTVTGSRGARLVAPPGAFVDGSGKPVSGMVDVHLTPLDPSIAAERAAAPGFVAQSGGASAMLESFGMADVTVKQNDGKVGVAPGKQLELHIPVPSGVASPEATQEIWSFDESKGIWVDEGTGTYDPASNTYVATAKHLSMWNTDKVYLATCVCGLVNAKGGGPLAGARVEAEGVSYFGTSSTNAGADGTFCVAVRKDSDVDITAYHKSGGGQSRAIKSGHADTSIPPQPGDARCVDVGVWEVEQDVFIGSTGTTTACGDVGNPLAGTCAESFGVALSSCYQPSGACTATLGADGETISYANGASVQTSGAMSKYFSATGQLCATSVIDLGSAASGDDVAVTFTLPNGQAYALTIGGDGGGDITIKCPNGDVTTLTPDQRAALEACTSKDMMSSQAECTIAGGDDGGVSDAGIGIPTACTDDSMCTMGNVCCVVSTTDKLCLPPSTCALIPKG